HNGLTRGGRFAFQREEKAIHPGYRLVGLGAACQRQQQRQASDHGCRRADSGIFDKPAKQHGGHPINVRVKTRSGPLRAVKRRRRGPVQSSPEREVCRAGMDGHVWGGQAGGEIEGGSLMPIAALETALYRIQLPVALSDSTHGTMTHFELVTVRLRDSDGAEGVGWTYTTGAGGAAVHALIDQGLRGVLQGADPDAIEALWHKMWWRLHYGGR